MLTAAAGFTAGGGPGMAGFAEGTLIATPEGEVPVERLNVSDTVRTRAGSARVVWLGHRRVECRSHPSPRDVWPVRVQQGAFGPGLPARDLLLSPDHAVFLPAIGGGVLVPVRYLINGASIRQEPAKRITYWHVELPRHDVLLAEGLPCESYLDTGNRADFANGGQVTHLHPALALNIWARSACAPLVRDGALLAEARAALLPWAAQLGHVLLPGGDLHLMVGQDRIDPDSIEGGIYRFTLRRESLASLRIVSRSGIPAEVEPHGTDTRRLGALLERMALFRPWAWHEVNLWAQRGAGLHVPERDGVRAWRWTDGDALITLPEAAGVLAVELHVGALQPGWAQTPAQAPIQAGRTRKRPSSPGSAVIQPRRRM